MVVEKLLRLARTVRHLRAEQIAYRLYYRLARPLVARRAGLPAGEVRRRSWRQAWSAPRYMPARDFGEGGFEFLGERGVLAGEGDWNNPARSKLWLYNLHYFDDLDAVDAETRNARQIALFERWIRENPPLAGNGWEPYVLSLRLVNLVKWFGRQDECRAAWVESFARQAQALLAQREFHILANHLFANGKALVFAGSFFAGAAAERWLAAGLQILDREIPEQFLADGGHFELSPMYHATLLWDLCDLLRLAECSGHPELLARAEEWRGVIARGVDWLAAMSHPDGEISFFNDAAFGIAPRLEQLRAYALSLGARPVAARDAGLRHLAVSGYVAIDLPQDGKLLLDVAQVAPDYQPGHAHADTLSCELSLFGQRLLVNSGTSCYGLGAERQRQRSTAAHTTVEVDGEDSSEVWAGFRVARRARPQGLSIDRQPERVTVRCAHDGYRRLPGRVTHLRAWQLAPQRLRIEDELEGTFATAVARYFLHPSVRIGDEQTLILGGGQAVRWRAEGGVAAIISSSWHPSFGASVASHCLELRFAGNKALVEFSWG